MRIAEAPRLEGLAAWLRAARPQHGGVELALRLQLARHVERLGGIADDLNRRAARLREIEAETDRAIAMVNEGRWVDPNG